MKKNYYFKAFVTVLTILLLNTNTFAFHRYSASDSHPDISRMRVPVTNAGPTSAPFDGGLTLLIAAGIGYASKKGFDKRKKQKALQNKEK